MSRFPGFVWPEENWFRLPNQWTDLTYDIKSLAELKVIEYVLRHTWGYKGQWSKAKRISLDEFANGRRRKNGSRIDRGIGMAKSNISNGLKLAVEHSYLEMMEDSSDKGRIKRYYRLVMIVTDEDETNPPRKLSKSEPAPPSTVSESSTPRFDTSTRTEKDNLLRKSKKKIPTEGGDGKAAPPPRRHVPSSPAKGLLMTDWDRKGGRRLREVLARHDSDLTHTSGRRKGVRSDTLAKTIFRLRTGRSVPKIEIKEMIDWLDLHWDEEYVPRLHKADDLFVKWGKFRDAKTRWEREGEGSDGPDPDGDGRDLVAEVGNWLLKKGLWDPFSMDEPKPDQAMIDEALVGLCRRPGTLREGDVRGAV